MALWNTIFHYKAGTNSVGDMLHYIVARVAFSWNASVTQKAMYQNILEDVHDERLALSYTYARIQQLELKEQQQRENELEKARKYENQVMSIQYDYADKMKREFIEEQIRWERQGLTPTEIEFRRIQNNNIPRKELLQQPIILTVQLFSETMICVHDKIGGNYTIEIRSPYWASWDAPIFRWNYKGDAEYILSVIKQSETYALLCRKHAEYMEEENKRLKRQIEQDQFNQTEEAQYTIFDTGVSCRPNNELKVVSHKKKQSQVDHVRAAMGQSSIDDNLIDDTIF